MQREAESHAEEDRTAREAAEVRNNADNLAYQSEKQLKEMGDKIPEAARAEIEKDISKLREALKGSNVEEIKTAYTELQNKFQAASEELYKQTGGAGAPGADAGHEQASSAKKADKGDVVDADFEVIDDNKKKQ